MLLAKFIEGFIFGIKKTNRLDDDSRGEELLILADQVSTGIKEVEDQLNQGPVSQKENGGDEKEDADTVNREPENSLDKETIHKVGGEQTRWWLAVKEEEKGEGSRKDLLDLANNFYQKAQKENKEKTKTVEYVPYNPAKFPKDKKNTTIHDETVNNAIDVQENKIEETERTVADQIVDKVKMSIVAFDEEREDNLNLVSNDNNLNLVSNDNNLSSVSNDNNLNFVSNDNKGTGFFEEVDLAPTIGSGGGEKEEVIENKIEVDDNLETEGIGMFDKVGVLVKVEQMETKADFQDGKDINNDLMETEGTAESVVLMIEEETDENTLKTEAELEDEMLTDWFQKMEDALNGVQK